jgi:hypothetical protein
MKKHLLYLIPLLVVMAYLLFFSNVLKQKKQNIPSDPRMDSVDLYIREGRIDSAYSLLQRIIIDPKDALTFDSALSLQSQIQKIVLLDLDGSHIDVMLQLTSEEYENLLKHSLKKKFLSHPLLNDFYLKKLYEKSIQSSNNITPIYSQEPQPDTNQRREYAQTLSETYADLGFEITVMVAGTNNNELVLRSPVFDETWFAKFDSGGDLEAWHNLGFTRVQIENGSGFVRHKEWD